MVKRSALGVLLVVAWVGVGCGHARTEQEWMPPAPDPKAEEEEMDLPGMLAEWFQGSFVLGLATPGGEQMRACLVDAPSAGGAYALYVEQGPSDKPERQRLYALADEGEGRVLAREFSLKDPAALVGACQRAEMASVGDGGLVAREGCAVHLKWLDEEERFIGGTVGKGCAPEGVGPKYETTMVEVFPGGVQLWVQGFDEGDARMVGPEEPVVFQRAK